MMGGKERRGGRYVFSHFGKGRGEKGGKRKGTSVTSISKEENACLTFPGVPERSEGKTDPASLISTKKRKKRKKGERVHFN